MKRIEVYQIPVDHQVCSHLSPEKLCDNDPEFGLKAPALIAKEDARQIEKWGYQTHSMQDWLMFATEEMGELAQAMTEYLYRDGDIEDIEKEALQAATLNLKIAWMCRKRRGG